MDVIRHSMPTAWKNKMIDQGFNFADTNVKEMTSFFKTTAENLEPKEYKKTTTIEKKHKDKISIIS